MSGDVSRRATASRATDRPGDPSPFALGLVRRRAHWHAAAVMTEALRPLGIELRHFAVLIVLANRGPNRASSTTVEVKPPRGGCRDENDRNTNDCLWTRRRVDSAHRHRFCRMRRPRMRPNVTRNVVRGAPCVPRKAFDFGFDAGGATFVCNTAGVWAPVGPLIGVCNVALPCPGLNLSAQGFDGVPFQCVAGR